MSDNSYYDSELKRWLKNGINKNGKNGCARFVLNIFF